MSPSAYPSFSLSAARAEDLAGALAGFLHQRGLRAGATVIVQSANTPELLAGVLGVLRSGMRLAILHASLTEHETSVLTSTLPGALFVDEAVLSEAVAWRPATDLSADLSSRPIHFTSGTSGVPKAVWSGWFDPARSAAWRDDEVNSWGFSPGDTHLVSGPLSHSAPLRFALHTLLAGGTVIVPPRFDAALASQILSSGAATTAFMAPIHLARAQRHGLVGNPALRLLAHAGSPCPDDVRLEAIERLGTDALVEFYGSTEGGFTVCPSAEWLTHRGTVGRALPGRRVRVDEEGMVWCQAPDFAHFDYLGDPVKTAHAWRGDWFTVGDMGYMKDDYLYLEGRRSDLIISGGQNVYPAEVESELLRVPGVDEVVVFARPDPEWGQQVCAVYCGVASATSINEHARENLAAYKRPKVIVPVDQLPRTATGKVDRSRLSGLLD